MAQTRVTIADVARHAELSPTAVSLVLNGRAGSRVSEESVGRIRAAVAELGYRPNLTARALSTRRSDVIGFVSRSATFDRVGSRQIQGALKEAREHGYVLFFTETQDEQGADQEAIHALLDRGVAGLIYAAGRTQHLELPAVPSGVRVVLLNATSTESATVVLPDEYRGGRDIVELLLSAGHNDGLVVLGRSRDQLDDPWNTVAVRRRLDGIWAALDAAGVSPVAEMPLHPWETEVGYTAVRGLIDAGTRPRALVCLNDRLAFGAYLALQENGLRIPQDVSIVSFDDDELAGFLHPPLTTAALPHAELGSLAVSLLLDPQPRPGEHLVPMPIRVRGSVAGVARRGPVRPPEP